MANLDRHTCTTCFDHDTFISNLLNSPSSAIFQSMLKLATKPVLPVLQTVKRYFNQIVNDLLPS